MGNTLEGLSLNESVQTLSNQSIAEKQKQRLRLKEIASSIEVVADNLIGTVHSGKAESCQGADTLKSYSFEEELAIDWNETNEIIHRLNVALGRINTFI